MIGKNRSRSVPMIGKTGGGQFQRLDEGLDHPSISADWPGTPRNPQDDLEWVESLRSLVVAMRTISPSSLVMLAASVALASDPGVGDTREQVMHDLGAPKGQMQMGKTTMLYYDRGAVELTGGKVTKVQLVSQAAAEKSMQAPDAGKQQPVENRRQTTPDRQGNPAVGTISRGSSASQNSADPIGSLRALAEQGNAAAQYTLGLHYSQGNGVARDMVEAVKWTRKAAEQGMAAAQYNLACCYAEGDGPQKDMTEAVKWLRKAAEQGHADAQYHLGVCYYLAQGLGRTRRRRPNGISSRRSKATRPPSTISGFVMNKAPVSPEIFKKPSSGMAMRRRRAAPLPRND